MQTLKIEIPNGYEFDSFNKLSGEIKLREKPKNVIDRIKTVEDVVNDNGFTRDQFDEHCKGLEPDEVAYRVLKLVAKSLNEGWTPDWSNPNEYKYFPWFEMRGSSGFRFYVCVLVFGFERRLSPLLQVQGSRRVCGQTVPAYLRNIHDHQIKYNGNRTTQNVRGCLQG